MTHRIAVMEQASLSLSTFVHIVDERKFENVSDHLTVWVDRYIGEENSYENLKKKFHDQVQVLKSNNANELEIDDYSMVCADQKLLDTLSHEAYCLKYFSNMAKALTFIDNNPEKTIFFISSGTIGQVIVPEIVSRSNVKEIYIFCGNISAHTKWASEYSDRISGMFEHQDDLLERLTHDIGIYVEQKGDRFFASDKMWQAKNSYAWAKKLFYRNQNVGCNGAKKLLDRIEKKIEQVQSPNECSN